MFGTRSPFSDPSSNETGGVGEWGRAETAPFSGSALRDHPEHTSVVPPSSSASAEQSQEATHERTTASSPASDPAGRRPEAMSETTTASLHFSGLDDKDRLDKGRKYSIPRTSTNLSGLPSELMPKASKSPGDRYLPSSPSPELDDERQSPESNFEVAWKPSGFSASGEHYTGGVSGASFPLSEPSGVQRGGEGACGMPAVPDISDISSPHAYINRVFYISYPAEENDRSVPDSAPDHTDAKEIWPRKIHWVIFVSIFAVLMIGCSVAAIVLYATKEKDEAATSTPAVSQDKQPSGFIHPDRLTLGEFAGSFKVMTKWDPALNDLNGDAYKRMASTLTHTIHDIFNASYIKDEVKENYVTSLREGSIKVTFLTSMKNATQLSGAFKAVLASVQIQEQPDLIKTAFNTGLTLLLHEAQASGNNNNDNDTLNDNDSLYYLALIDRSSVTIRPASAISTTVTAESATNAPRPATTATSATATTMTTAAATAAATTVTTAAPTSSSLKPVTTTSAAEMSNGSPGLSIGASQGEDGDESTTTSTTNLPPCGVVRTPPTSRIIGGSAAPQGLYPWMVMLGDSSMYFCGGSIIDPLHVLTAAHCLEDYTQASALHVVAGTQQTKFTPSDDLQAVNVSAFYTHKQYNIKTPSTWNSFLNDIAVLKLAEPLRFTSRVSAVCLPEANATLPARCIAAGWGATNEKKSTFPDELQVVTLDTYNHSRCAQVFGDSFESITHDNINYYLTGGVMCAANGTAGGLDTCFGDSGGPLFCLQEGEGHVQRYTQFGVVSWGEGCALPGSPGFYAYLPYFRSWLDTVAFPALRNSTAS